MACVTLAALLACGGRAALPFDPGPPLNPLPTGAEPTMHFIAARRGAAMVVAVHPDTGDVDPFGPNLPDEGHNYGWTLLYASAARAIVWGVDLGASVVLVGDGTGWRDVVRAPDFVNVTSDDGTAVVVSRLCDPKSIAESFATIEIDGGAGFGDVTCASSTDAPAALLRAPGGGYLVLWRGEDVFVRSRDGRERRVTRAPLGSAVVFETSFAFPSATDPPSWFDANGDALDIADPSADVAPAAAPAGVVSYQVSRGALFRFRDRVVERLQAVPSWVSTRALGAIVPGRYAVVPHPPDLAVLGRDGAPLATLAPGPPYRNAAILAQSVDAPWPWVIAEANRFTPILADDVGDLDERQTLYLLGDPSAGRPPIARTLARNPTGLNRTYWASATGRYFLYMDRQGLHSVDIATQTDITIGGGFDY